MSYWSFLHRTGNWAVSFVVLVFFCSFLFFSMLSLSIFHSTLKQQVVYSERRSPTSWRHRWVCVYVKKSGREEKEKVSYYNFVVFSRSARMPTTTIDVHALPHLTITSINFESSVIVCMHIYAFVCPLSLLFIVKLQTSDRYLSCWYLNTHTWLV